jgi:cytochrome P450 family 6
MFYYIILVLVTIYLILKYVYSHWERNGFPFKEPTVPFGNLLPLIQKKRSFGTVMFDLYNSTYEPFIGIYLLFRPAILVKDAELVRHILVKDFNAFHDRGVYCNETHDPVSANLFAMPGQKWRHTRSKLTPTFTSGKLKNMMATILKVGDDLTTHINPLAIGEKTVEMKEMMTCYTLNLIASVFFGLDINTFDDPNHQFRLIAKELVSDDILPGLRVAANFLCPK